MHSSHTLWLSGVIIFSLLTASSQVPQYPVGSMFEPSFPELQAYVLWQPVPGAIGYKIYEYGSVGSACPLNDSAYVYDTIVTAPVYLDDPNPAWWKVDVNDRGNWQRRWWCYEISAVVNGQEGPRTKPVQVAIGTSGYITMSFQTACTNGKIIPFPYPFSDMEIHLYYRDASSVDHEFDFLTNVASPTSSEVEWKIPTIAKDGTVIPLVAQTGYTGYWYSWKTPDMAQAKVDNFLPVYQPDAVSYDQTNIRRVQGGGDCPMPWERPGSDYGWKRNVTR